MLKSTRLPLTHFGSQERVPIEIIHRQAAEFAETPPSSELLDSLLNYVFVLNRQGQIVFASRNFGDLIQGKSREQILGARLGEVLGCLHAAETPGGCGTAESCQACGALQSIVNSLAGKRDLRDFHLTSFIDSRQKAVHFLVLAAPLVHNQEVYSLLALADGANLQARTALERLYASQRAERTPPGKS